MDCQLGLQFDIWAAFHSWNFWYFNSTDDTSLYLPVQNKKLMKEDILTTMFYLAVVFVGMPTLYYLTTTEELNRKRKNNAFLIYGCAVFIIILIPVLLYGAEKTQRAIGSGLGDLVMFLFYTAIIIGLMILLILLFLGNWGMLFKDLVAKIRKKP